MFGKQVSFLNEIIGMGNEVNGLIGNFGRRQSIDLGYLQTGVNALGGFGRLFESISALSRLAAGAFGFGSQGQPTSVFARASDSQLDLATILRQREGRSSELEIVVNGGPAGSPGPTVRQIGDGDPISVEISPEQLRAMSSYQERGADTVRTYGPNGGSYESVGKYFAANPNTLFG